MTRISPTWKRWRRALGPWRWILPLGIAGFLAPGALLGSGAPPVTADFISLDEIFPGMTGYGLTVFEGSRIDTFTVKVIGIQDRVRAAGSLILVEVGGHGLEKSNIAQGMSGSPVFLEGRLAGALAFGWGGALRPLAGVTPAHEILGLPTDLGHLSGDRPSNRMQGWADAGWLQEQLLLPGLAAGLAAAVRGDTSPPSPRELPDDGEAAWPSSEELILSLMAKLVGAGSDDRSLQPENWFINPLGLARAGITGSAAAWDAKTLEPGSACAVPLVTGDAQLGAIGTVTWVDQDDVFMMGHPFMQRGPVNLPLATAEILTVFPSRQISFKLGSVGRIVGTVHHDQRAGLSGHLGAAPDMVPVELEVSLPGSVPGQSTKRNFSFQVVDDPLLTPTLVFWTLYNSLLVEGDDASSQNLKYTIELDWEGLGARQDNLLVLEGVAAGSGGVGRLSKEWMAPISLLLNNPFAETRLTGVKAQLEISRPLATAVISGLVAPRLLAVPGQEILCQVTLEPRWGQRQQVDIPLPLPVDLQPGNYRLAVASAAEMFALEAQRAPGKFQVTSMDGMLDILRTQRSASTLVVALFSPGQSMVLAGREMVGLPERVSRVIRRGNMEVGPTMADFIARQELPTTWKLQGHAVRNIEVAPRTRSVKQERRP